MSEFTATCPLCKTVNNITELNTPDIQKVSCSKCGSPLGTVESLERSDQARRSRAQSSLAELH